MRFVIVLEGDPPVDLLSKLSKALSPVDKAAAVHPVSERTAIELEPGDALVRVEMPSSEGARCVSVKVGGK